MDASSSDRGCDLPSTAIVVGVVTSNRKTQELANVGLTEQGGQHLTLEEESGIVSSRCWFGVKHATQVLYGHHVGSGQVSSGVHLVVLENVVLEGVIVVNNRAHTLLNVRTETFK